MSLKRLRTTAAEECGRKATYILVHPLSLPPPSLFSTCPCGVAKSNPFDSSAAQKNTQTRDIVCFVSNCLKLTFVSQMILIHIMWQFEKIFVLLRFFLHSVRYKKVFNVVCESFVNMLDRTALLLALRL